MWTGKQVAEMGGITSRLLISLTEKGIVPADIDPGGRGSVRKYSERNILDLFIYKELNRLNMGYRFIKQVIDGIKEYSLEGEQYISFRITSSNEIATFSNMISLDIDPNRKPLPRESYSSNAAVSLGLRGIKYGVNKIIRAYKIKGNK